MPFLCRGHTECWASQMSCIYLCCIQYQNSADSVFKNVFFQLGTWEHTEYAICSIKLSTWSSVKGWNVLYSQQRLMLSVEARAHGICICSVCILPFRARDIFLCHIALLTQPAESRISLQCLWKVKKWGKNEFKVMTEWRESEEERVRQKHMGSYMSKRVGERANSLAGRDMACIFHI